MFKFLNQSSAHHLRLHFIERSLPLTSTKEIRDAFHQCMPLFIALGDEVRLTIIDALTADDPIDRQGLNVKQITERTSLSRPAIPHHVKILNEHRRVRARPKGTTLYPWTSVVRLD